MISTKKDGSHADVARLVQINTGTTLRVSQ